MKFLLDALAFALAHGLAYLFRFDFPLHADRLWQLKIVLPWLIPLKIAVFYAFGLYHGMWRYTSVRDFWRLAMACLTAVVMAAAFVFLFHRDVNFSRVVFLMDAGISFVLAGAFRFFVRSYYQGQSRSDGAQQSPARIRHPKRALIIGAGAAGEKILREIMDNDQLYYQVAGFVDDDALKRGLSIHGVPVLGSVEELPQILEGHDIKEVLITIPSATGDQIRRIVDLCKTCDVSYKTLPGIGEIIDGRVSVKVLRDVSYENLLGRPAVQLDIDGIRNYLDGRTVLITGCGGSIGSELCRQIIRFQPRSLVLLDAHEANLFQIQMELTGELYFPECHPVLGSVQDRPLMEAVFRTYRPQVVLHAAAYKHVPMLEMNPWEAVENNIVGSRVAMEVAVAHGVERFVLVSTDKAVRPTSVMGASKRITELLLQAHQGSGTRLMAVRFGNVVGSSGSVIPLFRRQIERGGPVTVTHPEVTRYFMTISEAAQLIIQAGAMGEGGEIFILEMGTQVKIVDMARDLIRLSGREPDRDIRIVFTGLRDGEKLYEELITSGEGIVQTGHAKIMVLRPDGGQEREALQAKLPSALEALSAGAARHDGAAIKKALEEIIPEYTPHGGGSVL